MPRYDIYHDAVRNALAKDGWTITDDPFFIKYEDLRLFADLGAEKAFAAEKEDRKIVVEIKAFAGPSPISELQKAMGQYSMYQFLLQRVEPDRALFLAVPDEAYEDFLRRPAVQEFLSENRMSLLLFNPDSETVTSWIS